jgi:hypothetical protein
MDALDSIDDAIRESQMRKMGNSEEEMMGMREAFNSFGLKSSPLLQFIDTLDVEGVRGCLVTTASRTMTRSTTTTTTTMAETVMSRVAFRPEYAANLPLLLPFEIRNPSESVLIQAIVNEQHASDALMAAMKCEETLRTELQKATLSSSENKDEIAKKKSGAAGAGAATKKGGTVGNANSKKKVKQSSAAIHLRKSIEREINDSYMSWHCQ